MAFERSGALASVVPGATYLLINPLVNFEKRLSSENVTRDISTSPVWSGELVQLCITARFEG
jgi:hypothetical protein